MNARKGTVGSLRATLALAARWCLSAVRIIVAGCRHTRRHLGVLRVPLFIVGVALASSTLPQIAELFSISSAAVRSDRGWIEVLLTSATSALLGWSIWYSARTLLRFDIVRGDIAPLVHANPLFRDWAPRIAGVAIPLLVAHAFAAAGQASVHPPGTNDSPITRNPALMVALAGVVVLVTTWMRRRIFGLRHVRDEAFAAADWRIHGNIRFWFVCLFVYLAVNVWVCAWPRSVPLAANMIGPLPILLALGALIVLVTTPLVFFAARARIPVFLLLMAWASLIQSARLVDNHRIQTLEIADRSTIDERIEAWLKVNLRAPDAADAGRACKTAYFISAEGGGIRAGAWTALVLAKLESELGDAKFAQCLVAASGVSGGSLGLAAFVAGRSTLLSRSDTNTQHLSDGLFQMLTWDFMSPHLLVMFSTDTLQRLLPWVRLPDRGATLESAFAESFAHAFAPHPGKDVLDAKANPFLQPFSALYAPARTSPDYWMPILLFNSTDVRSGARVIQSGLALRDAAVREWDFPGAVDLRRVGKHDIDISLASAVHNSARFTYVSPAGTLAWRETEDGKESERLMQLVDGGYFENSGTTTTLDILRIYMRHAKIARHKPKDERGKAAADGDASTTKTVVAIPDIPRPFVIHISNDPSVKFLRQYPDEAPGPPPEDKIGKEAPPANVASVPLEERNNASALGEILPPPYALLMTREARGEIARELLRNAVKDEFSAQWAHFTLSARVNHPLPLGWRIGDGAMCEMIRQRDDAIWHPENVHQMSLVLTGQVADRSAAASKSETIKDRPSDIAEKCASAGATAWPN